MYRDALVHGIVQSISSLMSAVSFRDVENQEARTGVSLGLWKEDFIDVCSNSER